MNRPIVAAVAVTVLVLSGAWVWLDARRETQYRRLLAVGDDAIGRGQMSEAIEAFSGALTLKPGSMIARLKRGDTYRRRGDLGSAVRDLSEATVLDPTAPRPLELLGDAHLAMGRQSAAASDYERAYRLDDRAPRVNYKLGLAYYRAGRTQEAIEAFRRAVGLDNGFAEAHYLLGLCLRDMRPPREAERALLRAVEIDPTFAAAREELAVLYANSSRPRQAIEQLEALSALEPTQPERLVRVAAAYARLGRRDAAILTLGRAAERHSDSSVVYMAIGRIWLEASESGLDRVALNKALEALAPIAAHPSATSDALTLYGRALYLSGNVTSSERTLLRAVERFPVDPEAFGYLAEAAERLGHAEAAREARTRYTALTGG